MQKYHCDNQTARTILANGLAHCPNLSTEAAEVLIPSLASFFVQLDINLDVNYLAHICPKSNCLKDIVREEAVKCCMDIQRELQEVNFISIATDKGNKKGLAHFVKILIWWDEGNFKVKTWTLDIDAAEGTSKSAAEAIDEALQKVDSPDKKIHLASKGSDGGGGGVGHHVKGEIILTGRAINNAEFEYLVATYSLHGLQLTLSNPILKCCGEGGLQNRNLMQLIHTAYSLSVIVKDAEWKDQWRIANQEKMGAKMKAPVLTRWEHVGEGATFLDEK